MQKCPNCKKETITNLNKLMLGPGRNITCSNCKAKITVPLISVFLLIPYLMVLFILLKIFGLEMKVPVIIADIVIFIYIHYYFVPLIKS